MAGSTPQSERFDIAVVGTGAVGLVAALTFAREGYRTCLIGPESFIKDGRTVALFQGSVSFFDVLGLWPHLVAAATPMETMRIIDDTGNLFHVPATDFHAAELGLDAFGWNIANVTLLEKLSDVVRACADIIRFSEIATDVAFSGNSANLTLQSGKTIYAALVIAADGRNSMLRQKSGIVSQSWSYPQSALTTILSHERDHENASTEFHTREGPFTLVPFGNHHSSLVWLMSPDKADRLVRASDSELATAVEHQAHRLLGSMQIAGPRAAVPMSGLSVKHYAKERIALVGETAHVFPPIGAQGLNLGLRDVADLRDVVIAAEGNDIGQDVVLRRYDQQRKRDVMTRTRGIDGLNRMLLSHHGLIDLMRTGGFLAVSQITPLRKIAMRMGIRPLIGTPQLMRGTVPLTHK